MALKTERVADSWSAGKLVDRRRNAVYDRVRLEGGRITPQFIRCFQEPVGSRLPGGWIPAVKSFTDTSMLQAGSFASPHYLIVQRFLFLFQPSTLEVDRNGFLANYSWELRIMEKIFNREPMLITAAIGKPEDVIEGFGEPDTAVSSIHKLGFGVAWDLTKYEKVIPSLCRFELLIQGTKPFQLKADVDFYAFLDGLMDYPVQ